MGDYITGLIHNLCTTRAENPQKLRKVIPYTVPAQSHLVEQALPPPTSRPPQSGEM